MTLFLSHPVWFTYSYRGHHDGESGIQRNRLVRNKTPAYQASIKVHIVYDRMFYLWPLLANVNSSSRSLYAIARPSVVCLSVCLSVVCNVRAPYSGGSNFRQYFYGIRYLGHPLTSTENSREIVPGEPLRRGS